MPITTSDIIEDAAQADSRRYVRYQYTFSEGPIVIHGPKLVDAAFDANADMLGLIPVLESQQKDAELINIEQAMFGGAAYPAIRDAALFNTPTEVDTFLVRRTMNRLRPVNATTISRDVFHVVQLNPVFELANAPALASWLGVSNADANSAKSEVAALFIAITGYDVSFMPTYPDVGNAP